ncbi:hypothetical protein CLOM_g1677 [Closterium sp. NIES-68]|nr:hypothetical protein CLOM_g1677 [Closterium sp. NIES-68]
MPSLCTRSLVVVLAIAQVVNIATCFSSAAAAAAHSLHGEALAGAGLSASSSSALGFNQRPRASSSDSLLQESPTRRSLKAAEGGTRGTCAQCAEQLKELQEWFTEFEAGKLDDKEGQQGEGRGGRGGRGKGGPGGRRTEADEVMELQSRLVERQGELKRLKAEYEALQKRHEKVTADKILLDVKLTESGADWGKKAITKEALSSAVKLLQSCKPQTGPVITKKRPNWKGYSCSATERELERYMDYETRGMCPDDWLFVQDLIFRKECHSLPKRRCLTRTAHKVVEPLSRPASLFSQSALQDSSVRWNNHACTSFACLNALSPSALSAATAGTGDACGRQPGGGGCWNMSAEERRWMAKPPKNTAAGGSLTIKEVIAIKKGALRIGIDFNGGSGSFAAHMARHNVTVMTSAMNLEANVGRKKGLPFLETIALRGLVPLWLPYKVRLPFYDNTLDILHATNAIKFMPSPAEFEEVLFEWDRVLRVGGVMWLEEFTASAAEMPTYLSVLDLLKYRHLHWSLTPPKAMIGKPAGTVILHCLLEKPMRKDL